MKLTVGRKLAALIAIAAAGLVTVGGVLGAEIIAVGDNFGDVTTQAYPSVRTSLEMVVAKSGQADDLGSFILSGDPSFSTEWEKDHDDFKASQAKYRTLRMTASVKALLDDVDAVDAQYQQNGQVIVMLVKGGHVAEATKRSNGVLGPLEDRIFADLSKLEQSNSTAIADQSATGKRQVATATVLAVAIPLAVLVAVALLGLLVARSILR